MKRLLASYRLVSLALAGVLAALSLLVALQGPSTRTTLGEIEHTVPAATSSLRHHGSGFVAATKGSLTASAKSLQGDARRFAVRASAPATAEGAFHVASLAGHEECNVTLSRARATTVHLEQGTAIYSDAYRSVDVIAVHDPQRFELLYYVRDLADPPELALDLRSEARNGSLELESGSGDVLVRNAEGRAAFRVTHPILVDARGTRRAGRYEVNGEQLRLALRWDGLVPPVVVDPSIVIPVWALTSDQRAPGSILYDPLTLSAEDHATVDTARGRLVVVRPVRSRQPDDRNFLFGDPVQEGDLQAIGRNTRTPQHGAVVGDAERADFARTLSGMETWEWDGGAWHRSPDTTLPARIDPALAFSPILGRTVLFGGASTSDYSCQADQVGARCGYGLGNIAGTETTVGATYEYDANGWTERRIAFGPSLRMRASMSAFRDGVVLFGGRSLKDFVAINVQAPGFPDSLSGGLLNDTWIYDGSGWRRIEVAHPPPPVESAQLVYDPERQVAVLVGGISATVLQGDRLSIWEFDGTDWAQRVSPDALPLELQNRTSVAAFWNPVSKQVNLFGGSAATFASCPYVGSDLANRVGAARTNPALSDQLAAIGCLGGYKHDLWAWDGASLTQLTHTAFGGYKDGKPVFRQIAESSGTNPLTSPPSTAGTGGSGGSGAVAPDAPLQTPQWPWRNDRRTAHFELRSTLERAYVEGAATASASGAPTVPPSAGGAGGTGGTGGGSTNNAPPSFVSPIFFPKTRPKVAFFASSGRFQTFVPADGEILESDGTSWQARTPNGSPFAAGENDFFAATWDSAAHRVVLFDPRNAHTWTYQEATGWTLLTPGAPPPTWSVATTVLRARDMRFTQAEPAAIFRVPQMAFDRARARAVMLYEGGVWEFDGANWSRRASLPNSWTVCKAGTSVAYDNTRHVTVAFGCVVPGETWEWDGNTWRGPFVGPYSDVIYRRDVYGPTTSYLDDWSGTAQLGFNHSNAAADVTSLGGVTTLDAGGSLRTWDGTRWKPGPRLPDGYACNAHKISSGTVDYPSSGIFAPESRDFGVLSGLPTCFFPPLVEDSTNGRLVAFRDGPRGLLEFDLTNTAGTAAWQPVQVGTGGGNGLTSRFDRAADAVYPHPYELWSPQHIGVAVMADPASEVFFSTGASPVLPRDKYRVLDWGANNLFWPFRLLRDPDTGRIRVLTHRGAVWELGGERIAKLGNPCQTADDCSEGTCTVEKVCCDNSACGSASCTTCLGATPGHCGPVPAGQPEPRGLCGGGGTECQPLCSGNYSDSVTPGRSPCVYDPARTCGPAASCADSVLTPAGHCSPTRPACITATTNLPECPVVNGQPVLTSECRGGAAPCPGGFKCADATHCKAMPQPGGVCATTADCSSGATCDPTTHRCVVGGCATVADCAPGFGFCDPAAHTCIAGGCVSRADCISRLESCSPVTHHCGPDQASTLATQLGIQPSTWKPPEMRTPQEIVDMFVAAGLPVDDQGRLIVPGLFTAGIQFKYDPTIQRPIDGARTCMTRLLACDATTNALDACVAATPRCATDTPWLGDPSGADCCPEACLIEYLHRRQAGASTNLATILLNSGCFPGID